MNFVKPMRAAAATDEQIAALLNKFEYMIASPKLDGIRCSIQHESVLTKSLKLVPNLHVQKCLSEDALHGYDGELIVGNPTAHDVYRQTNSAVMRIKGEPDFKLYVFDNCAEISIYKHRRPVITCEHPNISILEHMIIDSMDTLALYEKSCLEQGYEGVILRDPHAMYKHGKSTALQGGSIKIKRFTDAEAIITGVEEQMHNGNEATVNELGRTQRSSHQENKVPMGTMGALICKDLETDIEVRLGTGFSDLLRQDIWDNRTVTIGQMVKYKSFKIGVKDKPRHAVFLGFRHEDDM